MPYGFRAENNSGQVLIDSDLFHYHFVQTLTHHSISVVPKLIDGPTGNYDQAPNYPNGLDSDQKRGNIYKFTFPSNGAKPPMCFIKPGVVGDTAPYASIILTKKEGSSWEIWVLQSQVSSPIAPILYCFSPLDQVSAITTDTHGLKTFNIGGQPTFDSRMKPLKVLDSQPTTSPVLANTGSSDVGGNTNIDLSVNVAPREYSINNAPPDPSDIIYYCPSIAHCCQDKRAQRSDSGFQAAGYNSYFYAWARNDLWWSYYRAAYRIGSGNKFHSSYAAYASGHVWATAEDTSSLLGALLAAALGAWTIALALAINAAAFTSAGVASGSYYPYENDSKNEALDVPFILSRASFYD